MNEKNLYMLCFTICGIKIGFSFIGLPFIILALILYVILSVFDITIRFLIERKNGNVSSSAFGSGVAKRASKILLMGAIVSIFGNINYSLEEIGKYAFISETAAWIPIIVVGLFLAEEVISLIENSIEISEKDNKVLFFCKRILNAGMKKGMKIAEDQTLIK